MNQSNTLNILGQKKLQIDENKLRQFLSRKEMTVHHVRGIIVGCGGAGKTTLLKRLGNSKFKDIMNTKSTLLLDVHFNEFEVLEEEETIQSISSLLFLICNFFFYFETPLQLIGFRYITHIKQHGEFCFCKETLKIQYAIRIDMTV